jgi:hypothetical protein
MLPQFASKLSHSPKKQVSGNSNPEFHTLLAEISAETLW